MKEKRDMEKVGGKEEKRNETRMKEEEENETCFFEPMLFVNQEYTLQTFAIQSVTQSIACSTAASTDHDLTGQIIWPVSIMLSWFIVAKRDLWAGENVVEVGAGCGLCGLFASHFAQHVALTDGNDIVLDLLEKNVERARLNDQNICARKLVWGDEESILQFEKDFPHPVGIVIGADVICWPDLISPLLNTVKYLLRKSSNPSPKFYCGFVCRAQNTKNRLFDEARKIGFQVQSIPLQDFLPIPFPVNVQSNNALEMLEFTLVDQSEAHRFYDLSCLQTAY